MPRPRYGKFIQLRPTKELRTLLEEEAKKQDRSLNNLITNILRRYFTPVSEENITTSAR